jgi:phosphate transport system permease protein
MSARASLLPNAEQFKRRLARRHLRGSMWQRFFFMAIVVGLLSLVALLGNVVNQTFGYRAIGFVTDPATLTTDGRPLADLSADELAGILSSNLTIGRERTLFRDMLLSPDIDPTVLTTTPMRELLAGQQVPDALADKTLRDLSQDEVGALLAANLGQAGMLELVDQEVVGLEALQTWTLLDSIFQRPQIEAAVTADYPGATLEFRSWLTLDFLTRPMSANPLEAGIRTAMLGTLWLIAITLVLAFPIGVGAAIYLEEYARDSWVNNLIETNIRNLAGVPSIIYGLLGLAIFVRTLGEVTGGRSILSGSLTMALLILPVIIINAQEALRAVPSSIREASYGLGATQWQTIWNQVLPAALPGILTGTILATSRAIGETAPLIVVGAITFIRFDPTGPLSRFTALPIQIYVWSQRPEQQFHDVAAATIVALLVLLLSLNATAIVLRQRFKAKLQG